MCSIKDKTCDERIIAWKLTFVQFWLDHRGGYMLNDERNREQIKNTTSVINVEISYLLYGCDSTLAAIITLSPATHNHKSHWHQITVTSSRVLLWIIFYTSDAGNSNRKMVSFLIISIIIFSFTYIYIYVKKKKIISHMKRNFVCAGVLMILILIFSLDSL